MFYFVGVGLAFFLNVLLISKKTKTIADWVLACWLTVMMLHLGFFAFFQLKIYPQFLGIELPMPLLHGPLLYLYTIALTRNRVTLVQWLGHLAIPASFFIYLIHFFLLPTEEKIYVYDHEGIGYETFLTIRAVLIQLSGVVYVLLSTFLLRKHRKNIENQFSSTARINLLWLQYLIAWIGAIWVLVMFHNDQLIFGATVIFVFFIGYFGIRQVGIFSGEIPTDTKTKSLNQEDLQIAIGSATERIKYQKSGLTAQSAAALRSNLSKLMTETKAYCEPELSLADLAERLDVPPNHLSQLLNETENKSFYDYVNTLRIEEFLRIAARPESRKLTLYGLAQQCGFNSKSSFNRYFKKVTNSSPTEYLKTVTIQLETAPDENP